MRTLGVGRLSVDKEETTSPQRQREIITAAAAARGSTIIGWAEDRDIPASKTHPMQRPELAKWLGRPDEFDEILFWRIDRFARGAADLADMIRWSDAHRKGLASATEPFDIRDPLGEGMDYLAAVFGKMEISAISERVTGPHKYLREHGRSAVSKPPYASLPIPRTPRKASTP